MNNSVSIVTGASRGIGRAIVKGLSKDTHILAVARNFRDLPSLQDEIIDGNFRHKIESIIGDVSNPKTALRVIRMAVTNNWKIKNLICNAGIGTSGATHTLDFKEWQKIFDVNVNGCFHFVRACLPSMLEQGFGNICIMSSTAGLKGYSHNAAYVASKHALVGFAKALAIEYGKYGITVVPICPGFVESDMTTRTINGVANRRNISYQEARVIVEKVNPQKRILAQQEIVEAVKFICSGNARALSGNPLILSGGE